MNAFTKDVIDIIKRIPTGKVMTYGQIASLAGNPWGSRQISRILHSMSAAYELPWHRVVNSKGAISLQGEGAYIQKQRLVEEGVKVDGFNINLEMYLFVE